MNYHLDGSSRLTRDEFADVRDCACALADGAAEIVVKLERYDRLEALEKAVRHAFDMRDDRRRPPGTFVKACDDVVDALAALEGND